MRRLARRHLRSGLTAAFRPARGRAAVAGLAFLGAVAACKRGPPDDATVASAILARHTVNPSLKPGELRSDVEMFVALRREIAPLVSAAPTHARVACGTSASAMPCDDIRDRDPRFGSYADCEERIFVHDAAVAEMRVACSAADPATWPLVIPFAVDAFTGAGAPVANEVRYVFRDDALLAKARTDKVGDLGPLAPVDVPPDLAEAYDTLMSPVAPLALGDGCGYEGSPGRGHAETDALVKAGRFDLLRNVARGLNKEARVRAALALYDHAQPLTAEDIALLQKIRATTHQVRECGGGSVDFDDADKILPDPTLSKEENLRRGLGRPRR